MIARPSAATKMSKPVMQLGIRKRSDKPIINLSTGGVGTVARRRPASLFNPELRSPAESPARLVRYMLFYKMSANLVFVTGATGYIGAPFVGALLDAGYQVRVSVRSLNRFQVLKDLYPNAEDRLECIVVDDMTSLKASKNALVDVDIV